MQCLVDEAELAGLSAKERELAIKRAKNREAARRWAWGRLLISFASMWHCQTAQRACSVRLRSCTMQAATCNARPQA